MACRLAALTPFGSVLDNPVGQRPLKPNIPTSLLRLDPFVLQNLFPFRLKFTIERRVLQQIVPRRSIVRVVCHNRTLKILCDGEAKHLRARLTTEIACRDIKRLFTPITSFVF